MINTTSKTAYIIKLVDFIGYLAPNILFIISCYLLRNKPFILMYYFIGFFINILFNVILKSIIKQPRPSEDIKLFNIAINHENKKIKLNVRFKGDPLGSLYKRKFLKNRLRKIEIVKCQRLDKILDINQVIDFAKIDTEGNEMNVLNGIGKLIYNFKIIQIEFGGTWIDSRFFYRDLYEFFKDKNFFLYRMSPNKLIKIIEYNEKDEYFTFTNFIAINNNYVFTTTKSKNKVKSK